MSKADSSPSVGKKNPSSPSVHKGESTNRVIKGIEGQPVGQMYVIADEVTLPDGTTIELHYNE